MTLNFEDDLVFSFHYEFLRFIVFLNILFHKDEFLLSDDYKIGEYLEGTNPELYESLRELIMTSQDAYYSNLNEVNTFVHTYQLKSLDIEEKYIDVSTSVCLKHKEEYIDQIKKNEGLLFLYNNCHRFYTQVLSLEKIELKAFITYLNTTLDDKIFDEFTEILISHYKELYMPKEID